MCAMRLRATWGHGAWSPSSVLTGLAPLPPFPHPPTTRPPPPAHSQNPDLSLVNADVLRADVAAIVQGMLEQERGEAGAEAGDAGCATEGCGGQLGGGRG
jgi:hypothetical protein